MCGLLKKQKKETMEQRKDPRKVLVHESRWLCRFLDMEEHSYSGTGIRSTYSRDETRKLSKRKLTIYYCISRKVAVYSSSCASTTVLLEHIRIATIAKTTRWAIRCT